MSDTPANGHSALVGWYKQNAWLPVMASMLLWVGAGFVDTGGNVAVLSLAAAVATAVAVGLLAAVKIADYVTGGESEAEARQRGRNIAIALALLGMVVMFYAATIVRMGAAITGKAL